MSCYLRLILISLQVLNSFGFIISRETRSGCLANSARRAVIHVPPSGSHHFRRPVALELGGLELESVTNVASTLFKYEGHVPIFLAFGINAVLFGALSSKLTTMLTPTGFAHSMALGTLLWATLGWRGWSLCVMYLFLGQLVTKVRFAEKEKRGLAEKRGGRRGPENVW